MDLKEGIAVDIDETLSLTAVHYTEKLQELYGNPEGLTAREIIAKYRYTYRVPYWNIPEAIKVTTQWVEDNEVQKALPLIEDCDHYLAQINKFVPISCYLTMRPQKVLDGTQHWLEKHSFPRAPIVARPPTVGHDGATKWKALVLEQHQDKILGIIDDNVSILKHLKKYKGIVFLYDHDETPQSNVRVIACKDWPTVFKQVKKHFTAR